MHHRSGGRPAGWQTSEKKVPLDWITPDGMQVTAAFEEYARPLILDEVTPVYVNGTPRHICL